MHLPEEYQYETIVRYNDAEFHELVTTREIGKLLDTPLSATAINEILFKNNILVPFGRDWLINSAFLPLGYGAICIYETPEVTRYYWRWRKRGVDFVMAFVENWQKTAVAEGIIKVYFGLCFRRNSKSKTFFRIDMVWDEFQNWKTKNGIETYISRRKFVEEMKKNGAVIKNRGEFTGISRP